MDVLRRPALLLLGIAILATALQGVQGQTEEDGPSESQCRPYIEKALKEIEIKPEATVVTTDDSELPVGDESDNSEPPNVSSNDEQIEEKEAADSSELQADAPAEDEASNEEPAEAIEEPASAEGQKESAEAADDQEKVESVEQNEEEQQDESEQVERQEDNVEDTTENTEEQQQSQESTEQEAVAEEEPQLAETVEQVDSESEEQQQQDQAESAEQQEEPAAEPEPEPEPEPSSEEIVEAQTASTDEVEEIPKKESVESVTEAEPETEEELPQGDEPQQDSVEDPVQGESVDTEEAKDSDETVEKPADNTEDDSQSKQSEEVEVAEEDEELSRKKRDLGEIAEAPAEEMSSEEAGETKETSSEEEKKADASSDSEETVAEEQGAEKSSEEEVSTAEEATAAAEESTEEQTTEEAASKEVEGEKPEETESTETKSEADAEPEAAAAADAAAEESAEQLPEEELTKEFDIPADLRSRDHVNELLKLDEESTGTEQLIAKAADITLRELKRLYENAIKPLEILYKYRDLSNRHFGDSEIFSKPLILFMGPWSGGKSSIINYLTDNEYTLDSLRTGAEPSPAYFNLVMWGEEPEVLDGTQLAADFTFAGLQKFGQGLEERLRGQKLPNKLLEKVNIVEIPGILEVRKQVSRVFPFNDACQWFIDRADIIFLVYDPSKLDVGPETEAILDQLKGREHQTRIILNKADQVKPEELMRVQGALIWNISPLMSSAQPPVMYTTSLWSRPYEIWAPTRLLQAQERAFLRDLRSAIDKRIENKIASARRFAVRVRNHAKMVDCYLTTYYNHKSVFGNRKVVADSIIEHPQDYHIYEGLSTLTNISRYDLPDPDVYRDFFRLNPLYDFQQLAATCTYFRGCPINRLDVAIAYDLPELVGKHRKLLEAALAEATPTS